MAVARIEALLPYPAETVWRIVTDCTRCDWRSDLDRIETHGDGSFTEYTKSGYATRFTVTEAVPCSRWAFRLEKRQPVRHVDGAFRGARQRHPHRF